MPQVCTGVSIFEKTCVNLPRTEKCSLSFLRFVECNCAYYWSRVNKWDAAKNWYKDIIVSHFEQPAWLNEESMENIYNLICNKRFDVAAQNTAFHKSLDPFLWHNPFLRIVTCSIVRWLARITGAHIYPNDNNPSSINHFGPAYPAIHPFT